jgi:hypothetical protein
MKLRFPAILFSLALASELATANACVKVRNGESYECMKFSSSERRDAARYGLQLAAPFKAHKQALVQQGWVLDKQWLRQGESEPFDDQETICGSGLDAVCQSAFRKNDVVLVLTLSGTNEGKPLIAAEAVKRDRPDLDVVSTLTTPSFIIHITVNCEEGNVTCDDVTYVGTSKKTGKSIKLRGRTKHGMCTDRVTPCRFEGYEFWNGKTYYLVLQDGRLSVMHQNKTLLEERGRWE